MAIRYSDMSLDSIGARDFVARERTPTFFQIGVTFICAFLIGISIAITAGNKMLMISTLFALFSILGWYVIYQLMRSRDMMLATEFQNALFASAMGLHNKFSIIIKRDGTIIYLDRSFQTLFPDFMRQSGRSVEALLRIGRVAQPDMDRIILAIEKDTYEKVIFDITDAQGFIHRIILSVEPILRPAGFVMLRGREFVEERQAFSLQGNGAVLSKSSVTLFAHVMESMQMGVYISSPLGNIVYCNPMLEYWLGYNEGEIVARNLNISNLIPNGRNPDMTNEPCNVEGTVLMEKKVGGFMKMFINQKIINNEAGLLIGCTALIHAYSTESPAGENSQAF